MNSFDSAKDVKDAKGFEEVKGLVAELEAETARPYAPEVPAPFKQELRGQLLQAHEKRGLSWSEMGRLWRFAGTAIAIVLLVAAVVLFWAAISDGGTAVGPNQDVITVTSRANVIYHRLQIHSNLPEDRGVNFIAEVWQTGDGRQQRTAFTDNAGNPLVDSGQWLTFVEWMIPLNTPCHDMLCLIEQTRQSPPPGTAVLQAQQGCDGWGASLIDKETWPDGRVLDVLQISYGCYTTTTHSLEDAANITPPPESDYLLPQRRIIKVDPETLEILAIEDYDGENLLYSVIQLERQLLALSDLPPNFFSTTGAQDVAGRPSPGIIVARVDNLAVQLGEYLRLTGFTLNQSRRLGTRTITLSDGTKIPQESEWNELRLTLNWQVLTPLPHDDFTIMFHLTDEAGKAVQAIHTPNRLRSWSTWQEGEQIADFHALPIGDEVAAGHYYVWLSLYDSRTDTWLPVQTVDAQMVVKGGTAVQLAGWQYHPDFSSTFAESDVIGWSNRPANVIFGDGLQLEQYEIEEQEGGYQLTLGWRNNQARFEYLFAQLRNQLGELVWQMDVPPTNSEQDVILLETLSGTEGGLPDGRYDIIIGLYDPSTGQRLPVTADNERMVVDGGTAVWLTDWEFSADSHLCGSGVYDSETFQIQPCTNIGNDDAILSVVQKARPSATALVEIEVTVHYEPVTDRELFLKLHYAAPNWESFTGGGRMPIDGMSDYIPLNPEENNVTVTFTGNPVEMAQIVGTDRPALVVQLGYFVEGANGRELKILDMRTYPNAFDLSNPDEIRYEVIP